MSKNPDMSECPSCGICCDNQPSTLKVSLSSSNDCCLGSLETRLAISAEPYYWYEYSSTNACTYTLDLYCNGTTSGYVLRIIIGIDCIGFGTLQKVSCDPLQLEGDVSMVWYSETPPCCEETIHVVITEET